MICTFVGQAEIYKPIETKLYETIENCLKSEEEAVFYVGGRGEFDSMAAKAVRAAKNHYKEKKIRLYLVEPYMRAKLNDEKEYYEEFYDDVIIPPELAGVHPKSAITKRNRLMIDRSDLVIAYVYRDFGGAAETLRYAQKKGKTIINLV